MATRTWWGQRFIEALERFTDPGRLGRGRSYASNGRILDWRLEAGQIVATVRGSINPYFGVYKEPRYRTCIDLAPIPAGKWKALIAQLGSSASQVSRLLLGEMPEDIEAHFAKAGVHLLPHRAARPTARCSCPDHANPCKHVAGLYYVLASALDREPLLLFEWRGLPREELQAQLRQSPLGAALAEELLAQEAPLEADASFFPQLSTLPPPAEVDPRAFWQGAGLPGEAPPAPALAPAAALLIKREGDHPPFWHKEASFIEAMEDLYGRVRKRLV